MWEGLHIWRSEYLKTSVASIIEKFPQSTDNKLQAHLVYKDFPIKYVQPREKYWLLVWYFVGHFGTERATTNRLFPVECEGLPHSGVEGATQRYSTPLLPVPHSLYHILPHFSVPIVEIVSDCSTLVHTVVVSAPTVGKVEHRRGVDHTRSLCHISHLQI